VATTQTMGGSAPLIDGASIGETTRKQAFDQAPDSP
jgi:hypothetical protein